MVQSWQSGNPGNPWQSQSLRTIIELLYCSVYNAVSYYKLSSPDGAMLQCWIQKYIEDIKIGD